VQFIEQVNARQNAMSETTALRQKAEMFQQRADIATDAISKQHNREMAAHYRQLLVEHLDIRHDEPAH
jgi:hypothetical protein